MTDYVPVWPHGDIKEIFTDIFFVTGTNITTYNGVVLQHSRNMIIIRNGKELALINTVRLGEKGLQALDALGTVKNIVRIGAFHGRDDAFYLDRYHANLWALQGMKDEKGHGINFDLVEKSSILYPDCSVFVFETARFPEAILHLDREGGILITCDSIKNWLSPDDYFSSETAKLYEAQGFFGSAAISSVWRQACQVETSDFMRLKQLSFRHLLSAHGVPLLGDAYQQLARSIAKEFNV